MIYTAGQELLTRKDLHRIPVPKRDNVGKNWQGVEHGFLADTVVKRVETLGFKVASETWFCNPNQTTLYGSVDIDADSAGQFQMDLGQAANYSVGVRHDNGGRYSVSLAVGARITVCSNGLFTGDFVLKSKHQKSLDLVEMVSEGLDTWMEQLQEVDKFVKLLRGVELTDMDASYLMMKSSETLFENDYACLNWAHIQTVSNHWYHPPWPEFKERTAWSLYNAFTEVGKQLSPPRQMRMLKGLKKIMNEFSTNGSLN